jgi:hypothetical protein
MRWLAVVSVLLLTGCSSVQPKFPIDSAVAVHPPVPLDRPWLMPTPRDEVTLFDTRALQALRTLDENQTLNAAGTGRIKRPGLWIGIGAGTVAGVVAVRVAEDVADEVATCVLNALFLSKCD